MRANFASFDDKNCSIEKFAKELSINSLDFNEDDYLKYCLYESMRKEPVAPLSSAFTLTETMDIGKYRFRAGDMIHQYIQKLHHLEDQWGPDFDVFRPERFGEKSKRHPMSFIPFL